MEKREYHYLVNVQFLGFRYSGWQKQPGQKTIEGMLQKTLQFIWPKKRFKILGAGRTDAKVSAMESAFAILTKDFFILDIPVFLQNFNKNLPPDIRVISMELVPSNFNIIQNAKMKEYVYLFSFGEKFHPFCAPFMANFLEDLNIGLMKKATSFFEGTHDFSSYTIRLKGHRKTVRTIETCILKENDLLEASFFPKESYALRVRGAGFIRYQIRMMMGALVQLGKGELGIGDIERSLAPGSGVQLTYVAPASGLLLHQLEFEKKII